MADIKVSAKTAMTEANAHQSIMYSFITPSGTSYQVTRDLLLGYKRETKTADYTITLSDEQVLYLFHVKSTGTSSFAVGTTLGGVDIISTTTLTDGQRERYILDYEANGTEVIYVTILSGSLSIKTQIIKTNV
jgi:hypothetical protein